MANDLIQGAPAGFDCEFNLLRWPMRSSYEGDQAHSRSGVIPPNDIEGPRMDRLQQAFSRKCPQASGVQDGRRPDRPGAGKQRLRSDELRVQGQPASFVADRVHKCADEIFLLETHADLWCVWLIKRDEQPLGPDTGMPEMNRSYYDPDTSPLPGIPEWLASIPQQKRDALKLDDMYTPFLPGMGPCRLQERRTRRPYCRARPQEGCSRII